MEYLRLGQTEEPKLNRTEASEDTSLEAGTLEGVETTRDSERPREKSGREAFDEVPRILVLSESRLGLAAAIVGLVVGITVSVTIGLMSGRGTSLHRMFDPRQLEAIIPISILVMFFWGIAITVVRALRLGALRRANRNSQVVSAANMLRETGIDGLLESLGRVNNSSGSPLCRRLRAMLEQWTVGAELASVDMVLAQHAAHDEDEIHAGYSLLRTFIWALPVLGLIGTVIGISVAVGGFADFLGGDIEDVSVIKKNLVGVTGGLSYAFLITLLGLAASLILMLSTSALQTSEERTYSRMQQAVAEFFLPVLQNVDIADSVGRDSGDISEFRRTVREAARVAMEETAKLAAGLFEDIARFHQAHQERVIRSLEEVHDKAVASAEAHTRGAQESGEALKTSALGVVGPFAELEAALVDSRKELLEQNESQKDVVISLQRSVKEVCESLKDASSALGDVGARLEASVREAQRSQTELKTWLEESGFVSIPSALERHDSVLSRHAEAVSEAARSGDRLEHLANATSAHQREFVQVLERFQESGAVAALASLPEAVRELTPVLQSFREPFVWQAVPARKTSDSSSG